MGSFRRSGRTDDSDDEYLPYISTSASTCFPVPVSKPSKGMKGGWRCLMFDRFLARFYNRCVENDPTNNESFWREQGSMKYERDVLKNGTGALHDYITCPNSSQIGRDGA